MQAKRNGHPARRSLTDSAWWAAGSMFLAVVIWAFLNGPRLHAIEEQEIATEEEAETHDVCGRLRMPSGTAAYSACAGEIDGVRWQQRQRMERYAAGIL